MLTGVSAVKQMASSILDLSVSRGNAADTSSGASRRGSVTPSRDDSLVPELRVSTTDDDYAQTTSSDIAVDDEDVHTAHDAEVTGSSVASSDVSDDVVSRDIASRDIADRCHQSQPIHHRPPSYLDYQAAAAAAAATRFLVPFPFSTPAAAATGSAPVPPLNFYPLSFPGALPPTPEAAGYHLRPEGSTSGQHADRSRSTPGPSAKVKDDCGGGGDVTSQGHVVDPTYAERRRKNNEAARRSRDARRMKERETCLRAALLQQENVRLRAEMTVLKTEIARLHCLLYDKM